MMAKIRDIMAAKLNVQLENEPDARAVRDRKQRELEDLMGTRRETYHRINRRIRRK